MTAKPKTFDEYLDSVDADKRTALEDMRWAIHALVPGLAETISYGLPTFKFEGKGLAALGAWAGHCAFYPMSGTVIAALGDQLRGYETSKGAIRFQPNRPLPSAVVKRIVELRIAEIRNSR